jgi:hypothetical protein
MGIFTGKKNRFLVVLPLAAVVFLSSCSDDNEVSTKKAEIKVSVVGNNKDMTANKLDDKQYYKEMSQPLDKATWVEKGKFKKEFTKDCINRELQSVEKNKVDRDFFEKTCACIADYMDEHLTDQEAEEFLGEDNHMRALQIRYDTAAYQCIQGAKKTEEPKITRFQ